MAEVASKFVDRAPRYVLRASDNKYLRFAMEGDKKNVFTTSLVNISLTGLAFAVLAEYSPKMGDLIKLEIPVPGGQQIAWWAKVIRIEAYREPKAWHKKNTDFVHDKEKLVAVSFEQLPENIKTEIHQGLSLKAKQLARQKYFQFTGDFFDFVEEHWGKVFLFTFSTLFTLALLYLMSQPSGNYTAYRGAPWGQRSFK